MKRRINWYKVIIGFVVLIAFTTVFITLGK